MWEGRGCEIWPFRLTFALSSNTAYCATAHTPDYDIIISLLHRLLNCIQLCDISTISNNKLITINLIICSSVLPGVKTSVVETSLESWSGVDDHVDAVLLINVLLHLSSSDRRALFQKLSTQYLSSGGIVVIVANTDITSGSVLVMKRLGSPRPDWEDWEEEMVSAGFHVVHSQHLKVHVDLSNPSDDVVRYFERVTKHKVSGAEIRAAIDDIFSQPNVNIHTRKLAIFRRV